MTSYLILGYQQITQAKNQIGDMVVKYSLLDTNGRLQESLIWFVNNRCTYWHLLPPMFATKLQRKKGRTQRGSKQCKNVITGSIIHNTKNEMYYCEATEPYKLHGKSKEQKKFKWKLMRTTRDFEVLKAVLRRFQSSGMLSRVVW